MVLKDPERPEPLSDRADETNIRGCLKRPSSKARSFREGVTILTCTATDHGRPGAFERYIYLASVGTKSALGPNASAIKL